MAKTSDAAANARGYAQAQRQSIDRPALQAIVQRRFVPAEHDGDITDAPHAAKLTVDLGGEAMRCLVRLVIDEDTVIVEITGICMAKSHAFKQGDFVAANRRRDLSGRDRWVATARSAADAAQHAALAEKRRLRLDAQAPFGRRGEK